MKPRDLDGKPRDFTMKPRDLFLDFWNLRLGIEVSEWRKKKLTLKSKVSEVGMKKKDRIQPTRIWI